MPRNVNKASALRHIAEENGFTMDEVMRCDAENDIEMLRSCRYGIAMGNAMAAVKEAAFATPPAMRNKASPAPSAAMCSRRITHEDPARSCVIWMVRC